MMRAMSEQDDEIDRLLAEWGADSPEVLSELIPKVYLELKQFARRQLRRESTRSTFTPTELVNETYLKLAGQDRVIWENRSQFLAVAARLMRRILVDHFRRRNAEKRPPRQLRVTFSPDLMAPAEDQFEALAVDDALSRLESFAPHLAQVVELRWFAGCGIAEIAQVTGRSVATVKRRWTLAQAWLQKELRPR
jgi:RNA polymerase sigma factor (TIGR02999 family)